MPPTHSPRTMAETYGVPAMGPEAMGFSSKAQPNSSP